MTRNAQPATEEVKEVVMLIDRAACPCVAERRERARREALAFDVFANSTAHEEYRPS
jgi:hypothetical protein